MVGKFMGGYLGLRHFINLTYFTNCGIVGVTFVLYFGSFGEVSQFFCFLPALAQILLVLRDGMAITYYAIKMHGEVEPEKMENASRAFSYCSLLGVTSGSLVVLLSKKVLS